MGMYTEINLNIILRKDLTEEMKTFLSDASSGNIDKDGYLIPFSHRFFDCLRWEYMFDNSIFEKKGYNWSLKIEADFKVYDGELFHFIDFITPYIGGRKRKTYIGWSIYDGTKERYYHHIERCFD